MSDSNENLVEEVINEEIKQEAVIEEKQEDTVAFTTHKKLLGQFKQTQKSSRDQAARIAELEADRDNTEKAQLEQKQEYKKLYENALSKISTMETESVEKEKALVNEHKRRALERELGGLRKSDYFKFADLSNIVIADDGLVDENSVKFEANRYRQEFPELLKASKKVEMNNQAPSNDGIIKQNKSVQEMSKQERSNNKRDFLSKK